MTESETVIPASLLARLNELKSVLRRQGCVQLKTGRDRKPSFRIRYRSYDEEPGERHCSISLGPSQSVGDAVAVLIAGWQAETEREQEQARQQQEAKKREEKRLKEEQAAEEKEYLDAINTVLDRFGCSGRGRSRARRMFRAAQKEGPVAMLEFARSNEWVKPGKSGRPKPSTYW